jgi:hypothetical protein
MGDRQEVRQGGKRERKMRMNGAELYAFGGNPPKRVPLLKLDLEAVMLSFNARQLRIPRDFLPAAAIAAAAAADSLPHHSTQTSLKQPLALARVSTEKTKPPVGTPKATSWP